MAGSGLDSDRLARMRDVVATHTERGEVAGLAWALARRGAVHTGFAGRFEPDGGASVALDTIFRISSMTKPVTAVAALILMEECVLRLDDPVDAWLPELADRQVLARPGAALDDTVPAHRPITLRDLLTFRLGLGMDFSFTVPQPSLQAMAELGLGVGPPAPAGPPEPDEWIRLLGTVPLEYQPGERWLYHTSADVLGVLIARASGQPLEAFLRERIFDPLGMRDTGFAVPTAELDRFGPCYWVDPEHGGREAYDLADGQWSKPPAFPSGGAGLVSTVPDYLAFGQMLLAGGAHDGQRIVSRTSIDAMTTDQLTAEQKAASGPDPTGALGWGFGVGVQTRRTGPAFSVGTYTWDGGLGSIWANDPSEQLVGVLLTNQMWTSPVAPPVCDDFWSSAYAAIDD